MPEDIAEVGVLSWDGLALCVENLKTALETWSRQERVRALERQSDAAQAQQEASAISSALRKAGREEDPWEESLSALMHDVKAQRDELLKVVELLRKHKKLLKEDSDLADKIPKEDDLSPEELPSFVIQFLEQIAVEEAKPKAKEKSSKDTKDDEKKSKSTEAEDMDDEEKSKEDEKEKKRSRKEDKTIKTKEDRKKRPRKSGKDGDGSKESEDAYSDAYSDSASLSPSPRRRRRRRKHRRHRGRRHGKRRKRRSSSRSESYSPSRRRRRRKHRRRREDKEKLNVTAEIDRFVRVNKLEDRCEKVLRDLDAQLAYKVMGLSGGGNTFELSGDVRDPTAVVMARVRKAQFARDVGQAGRRRRSKSR